MQGNSKICAKNKTHSGCQGSRSELPTYRRSISLGRTDILNKFAILALLASIVEPALSQIDLFIELEV